MQINTNLTLASFLDLTKHELRNVILQNLASEPASPEEGQFFYDSAVKAVKVWDGTSWVTLASGASYNDEAAQDAVAAIIAAATHTGITVTYNDGTGTLAFAVTESPSLGGQSSAYHLARANHTGTQLAATISDFATAADARVAIGTAALVDSAPGTLDTLNELAAALGDDANFATTVTSGLAAKPDKFAADFGDAAATSFAIAHNLGTTDVHVSVYLKSSNKLELCDVVTTDANTVTLSGWTTAPASNAYRVVVVG